MKKFIALLIAGGMLAFGGAAVHAEEPDNTEPVTQEETEQPEVEVEVFESTVKINVTSGGDVLTDITEGHVGDIVTAYIKSDFLFTISSIKINGVITPVSTSNQYKFPLVDGENTIDVEFIISNEKLTEIAQLVESAKDNGIQSLFTFSNLLNFISWLVSFFMSSGFLITLIKSKKLKSKTVDQVVSIVVNTLQLENAKILSEFLEKALAQTMDKMNLKIDASNECIRVLCRCFVLAQDDKPENRLAIIEELTRLNNNDETLTTQIKAILKQEQEKQRQAIEERDKAIEELKQANESLIVEDEEETTGDRYGQL